MSRDGSTPQSEVKKAKDLSNVSYETKKMANPEYRAAQDKLKALLRDKLPTREDKFTKAGEKATGVSGGYVADRTEDKARHILKHAYKDTVDIYGHPDSEVPQRLNDKRDFITEYLTSELYKRALPGRSPQITLAEGTDKKDIYLTSKFFGDFKSLSELTGAKDSFINPSSQDFSKINGFEKVLAACLLAGEFDYHAGNIGVVPSRDDEGKIIKDSFEAVKIDHGRSRETYESEPAMRSDLASHIQGFDYQNIPINVSKLKEAVAQMSLISDDEISAMVGRGVADLQKHGVKGLEVIITGTAKKDDFTILEKTFVDKFTDRRDQLREFKRTLDVIEKIDGFDKSWKDGQWLRDIKGSDPIVFAIEEKKTIAGKDPVAYAHEKSIEVEGKTAREYALANSHKIDGTHPIDYFSKTPEEKQEAAKYAIQNFEGLQGKHPLLHCIENGIKLDGKDAASWMESKGLKVGEVDPKAFIESKIKDNPILAQAFAEMQKPAVAQVVEKAASIPPVPASARKVEPPSPSAPSFFDRVANWAKGTSPAAKIHKPSSEAITQKAEEIAWVANPMNAGKAPEKPPALKPKQHSRVSDLGLPPVAPPLIPAIPSTHSPAGSMRSRGLGKTHSHAPSSGSVSPPPTPQVAGHGASKDKTGASK